MTIGIKQPKFYERTLRRNNNHVADYYYVILLIITGTKAQEVNDTQNSDLFGTARLCGSLRHCTYYRRNLTLLPC